VGGGAWRFANAAAEGSRYTNAQIDDTQDRARRAFRWRPPLTLTVDARFSTGSSGLHGTAGFGFWNDPFGMAGARLPALPRAIWFFFASPPSDLKLDLNTPGHGWKAATIDASRPAFKLLALSAPLAVPLMNIGPLYRAAWPLAQRAIGVSEALIGAELAAPHTYVLRWGLHRAHFSVDGVTALDCATPPRGPLGFVMWIDNQAMVVTPWGRFGWRTLPIPQEQWMEITRLEIVPGE
jgi:hypothetical protein